MAKSVTISVDALGGDHAPQVVLEGCAAALSQDPSLSVILCGPAEVVEPFAASHERCTAQVTTEVITMGEHPAQACHALLREKEPNFVGNAEGRDILEANFDVFVTDGFTGNVALKTIEGTAGVLLKTIKGILGSSLKTKIGALCIKDGLMELKGTVSADTYGGAPLLGVKGACIVGHGSSNPTAIKNGILTSARIVREDVVGMISQAVSAQADKAGE